MHIFVLWAVILNSTNSVEKHSKSVSKLKNNSKSFKECVNTAFVHKTLQIEWKQPHYCPACIVHTNYCEYELCFRPSIWRRFSYNLSLYLLTWRRLRAALQADPIPPQCEGGGLSI